MARMTGKASWSLDIWQQPIPYTLGIPSIDSSWTTTCTCGTLVTTRAMVEVIDQSHWCDGTEGMFNHDPHEAIDKSHYECPQCGSILTPRVLPPHTQLFMPGMIQATVTGVTTAGVSFTAELQGEEIEQAKALAIASAEDQQRWLDDFPPSRYSSWTISR